MDGKRFCILVVDDDADTLRLMTVLLDRQGYDVRGARTLEEAKKQAEAGDCELVISDVGLAEDSGFELMRDLKALYGLKGIAVSGHTDDDDLREAKAAGFDRFIAKPVAVEHLLKTIEEVRGVDHSLAINGRMGP
jgi:DNA-binding response OmpR family regulator